MDMSDHLPRWGCPDCSRVFPSRDDLKKHLEPNKQLIINILSQLQQALSSSCQLQEATEGSTASEERNYVDLEYTKRSHARKLFRCPHSGCETKQAFRKDNLFRHYKRHVVCNVVCECEMKLDHVDQMEKHARDCQIVQGYKGGIAEHQKKYTQILGTVKFWNKRASQSLNEQLRRSLISSQSGTPNGQSLKRKRSSVADERTLETLHRTGKISHQENSMYEGYNGVVHLGSLDSLDSTTNYTYIAGNKPKATRDFGNSTPHLYPDESNNNLPSENTVDSNPLTHESNNFGQTRPSRTENNTENQSDWSQLYACDGTTNQGQWDFGSMGDSAHRNSSLFNTASGDGLDWNSLYAFNNIQASAWADAQGKATNI